jgi:hypothetical protein
MHGHVNYTGKGTLSLLLYAPFVALYHCTVAEISDSQGFDAGITECNNIGVLVCCILLLARARTVEWRIHRHVQSQYCNQLSRLVACLLGGLVVRLLGSKNIAVVVVGWV